MIATKKDLTRGEQLLQKLQVKKTEIKGFHFMERRKKKDDKGTLTEVYGAGILTLILKDGSERVTILHPRKKPSSIIRFLIANGIPFENLKDAIPVTTLEEKKNYHRPSIYMFWFFLLFIASLIMGYYVLDKAQMWTAIPALAFFFAALYLIAMLLTRFCYITLENDTLVIHSVGRSIRYKYTDIAKLNFDFAREIAFTHIMEIVDKSYQYRLFYIGRTSRKSLQEIVQKLQSIGVDATCSLNPNKRFYEDKEIYQ